MGKELLANQIKTVKVMEEEGATENVHFIFFFFGTLPAHAVCMHNNIHYRLFGGGGSYDTDGADSDISSLIAKTK